MKESFYSWNEYSFRFTQKALDFNYSPVKINELLVYAENLHRKKLPIIYDLKHLSFLTGFCDDYISRAIKGKGSFYRNFKIAKKNGKYREITEPLPGLKEIQYWILENLISKSPSNSINNAYARGKSIVTNAKYHTKQYKVLNMDIEKYFDNISTTMVAGFFEGIGYNCDVSALLTKLVTLNNGLPQGAPCSPYLSSILTKEIDFELLRIFQARGLRYSRYADDISVSGDFNEKAVIFIIKDCLSKYGFRVNDKKTTVKYSHERQLVTGVVVNNRLSIKKESIKAVRQSVYYITKFGLEGHLRNIKESRKNYLYHLLGKVNFFLSVKKKDRTLLGVKSDLKKLILLDRAGSVHNN